MSRGKKKVALGCVAGLLVQQLGKAETVGKMSTSHTMVAK